MKNEYLPELEKAEALTDPIEADPLVDDSAQFDFPFSLSMLPRLLAYSEKTSSLDEIAKRTITEGRAFSYSPVVFSRKRDGKRIQYCDLTAKGGGSEIKPNVSLFRRLFKAGRGIFYNTDDDISPECTIHDTKITVRFISDKLIAFTSFFGTHAVDKGLSDRNMSLFLESKGIRTRAMVALWKLPEKTQLATPDGLVSVHEFEKKTGEEIGLELWASRCKYRVQDILRFIYEMENIGIKKNPGTGMKLHPTRVSKITAPPTDGSLSHHFVESNYDQEHLKTIRETIQYLGEQIVLRAQYDEDERFKTFAEKYKNTIDEETVGDFFLEYLSVFADVLGEQMALLRNNDLLSGMLNLQNITLLCEMVDNDVMMHHGKVMDEKGHFEDVSEKRLKSFGIRLSHRDFNFWNQLYIGYSSVLKMIQNLSKVGILRSSDEQLQAILRKYLQSYKEKTDSEHHLSVVVYSKMNLEEIGDISNEAYDLFGAHERYTFNQDVGTVFGGE